MLLRTLALAVLACFTPLAHAAGPELVEVNRIWDTGAHNAFTDLVRFNDQWYCTFREADGHVKGDGKIRVIRSKDAKTWESVALIAETDIDLRDPKLSITPDGSLHLLAGGSVYVDDQLVGRQPRVMLSKDGENWTDPARILEEGHWLWRVTWHEGVAYGFSYLREEANSDRWKLVLCKSTDGVNFEPIHTLDADDLPGFANEVNVDFLPDGTMVALIRRDGGDKQGYIGTALPPYTANWSLVPMGHQIGGPEFIRLPDGRMYAGGRSYPGGAKTVLARMTTTSYEPQVTLPSGGDTSYPGLVWHDDQLWMSYYSSHEGKTSIYLARFNLPPIMPEDGIEKSHDKVYYEEGRFGGWPANHGMWAWGSELLVGYSRGWYKERRGHHFDPDKPEEHWLARSLDGGETWQLEHPAGHGDLIPRGESLHGTEIPGLEIPPLMDCPGGIDFTHPDFAMTVRMESVHDGTSRFNYSYDRGKTWEGPFRLPDFGAQGTAARTDYIVNGQHDCFIFITAAKSNGKEGRPLVARTQDGGKTWERVAWIGDEPDGFSIMPSSVRLSDSELYVALRYRTDENRWISAYRSWDNGTTWTPTADAAETTGGGNPPSLVHLADGRLCVTYGYRAEPFGIRARISEDGGHTWGEEIILRDDGLSRDLGYPRSVQRPDGKIVTTYYYCDPETGPERYIGVTIWTPPAF
jgi:hypothetical protein